VCRDTMLTCTRQPGFDVLGSFMHVTGLG
jgi:hypothetical protein